MERVKPKKAGIGHLAIRIKECGEPLIDLAGHGFVLDPVYFRKNGWGEKEMYLRAGIVKKLEELQKTLPDGYKFKIFDAYRPIKTQRKIYDDYKNKLKKEKPELCGEKLETETQKFVVSPELKKEAPPRHNTGGAVDLTIVDEKGEELNMGTSFDHFGAESMPEYFFNSDSCPGISSEKLEGIRKNRHMLIGIMSRAGFSVYPNEWWHWELGTQFNAALLGLEYAKYGSADLLDDKKI